MAVINSLGKRVTLNLDLKTSGGLGMIAAITAITNIVGPFLATPFLTRLGRFKTLLAINLLSTIGLILTAVSSYGVLLLGRALIGLAMGMSFKTVPLYIFETSPVHLKWKYGSMTGITLGVGIFIAYVIAIGGLNIDNLANPTGWRFVALFPIIVNILQLALMWFVLIESPTFYVFGKHDDESARRSLRAIYGTEDVERHLHDIHREKELLGSETSYTNWFKRFWRLQLLGLIIAMTQQASGISTILNWSNTIFILGGLTESEARTWTLCLGICYLVGALSVLHVGKRHTARQLFLEGNLIVCALLLATGFCLQWNAYLAARIFMLAFVLVYGATMGTVLYMLLPDLLPPIGIGVAISLNATVFFLIAYTFLYVMNTMAGPAEPFYVFTGCTLIGFIYNWHELPNTEGKSLASVLNQFVGGKYHGHAKESIATQVSEPDEVLSKV